MAYSKFGRSKVFAQYEINDFANDKQRSTTR